MDIKDFLLGYSAGDANGGKVSSVNGQTGDVVLTADDVGALTTADDGEQADIPHLTDSDMLGNKVPSYYRNHRFYGKKLACEGDSIMYGLGYAGGWAKIIADKYGMTLVNNAVTGGTVREFRDIHCISTGILSLPSDADYVIINGGLNDFTRNTFVKGTMCGYSFYGYYNPWDDGGVTKYAPYDTPSGFASIDKNTFCGAFEDMCINLITRFKGKKIGYVFSHRAIAPTQTDSGEGTLSWGDFTALCKQMLEKWGIPYIDLEKTAPPLGLVDTYKSSYTNNGDGWHPNENGYKLFYVDPIEEWLNTL